MNRIGALRIPALHPAPPQARLYFCICYDFENSHGSTYALVSTDHGATGTCLFTTMTRPTPLHVVGTAGRASGVSKEYPNGLTETSGVTANFTRQNPVAPIYTEQTAINRWGSGDTPGAFRVTIASN